jgi:hypothetical protein
MHCNIETYKYNLGITVFISIQRLEMSIWIFMRKLYYKNVLELILLKDNF